MPAAEKYKRIRLPAAPGPEAGAVVAAINGRFRADDFHVVQNGGSLEIWLREVDLRALSAAADEAAQEHGAAAVARSVHDAVAAVRSYGLNGRKRLYVGYDRERKVAGRKGKEARRGKHYYARDHDFGAEENALPEKFRDRIVCGDSEAKLKQLPDNCVDLVFTSPPYNFGLDYGQPGDDAADWEGYFEKLFRVFDECVRVLKFGGRIVVNVQPLFSDYIPSHHIISDYFMRRRLIWKGEILWEKNNYNCKYTAWGSWKSPASPYLKYTWEFLEVFCKGDLKKAGRAADADIDADSFKQWVTAKWSIAPERRMKEYGHPAMFPLELARRVLLLFSFRGDVVLDPFAGAGTTCAAARANGRRFLGLDVSAGYCRAARARLAEAEAAINPATSRTLN